ncbi:FtsX-like permease family protein, partial [Enterococcus faecium]|uniref:FtsX-like permease family protein n=1 Tax=Enterococcus faecium TaxID=1352 RepID=UPI0031CD6D1E
SLVTSLIMISIITYTSVIERTKEIGVLKALGARKKDITRVFDAETCILGISSGILGVFIAWLATFPINSILYNMRDLKNVGQLHPDDAIILVIVSTILT